MTTMPPRQDVCLRLSLALVVLAALGGALVRAPAAQAAGFLSGANGAGSPAAAAVFGTWRGAPGTVVNNFMPHATWADFANPGWGGPDNWKGSKIKISWAVPMLPESGGSIQLGSTGAYDTYFASMAAKLVADGQGNASIRLGWEMNGSWMTWNGLSDPHAWVAYWIQIVTTMRAVPGAAFSFLWSPSADVAYDSSLLYPGDAYVDAVGLSVYDQSPFYTSDQQVQRWNELYNGINGSLGLAWIAAFGKAHNKPLAFGEWGLTSRCDSLGGGDDPYFIQKMHDYFVSNPVAWEAYFNLDPSDCEKHSLTGGWFPNAAELYKQLWGVDAVTPFTASFALATAPHPPASVYVGDVTASLVVDGTTGTSATYSLDGAAAQAYTGPFVVTGDGEHTVTATVTDTSGRTVTALSTWLESHDVTPPVGTVTLTGTDDITVAITASDEVGGSGIASISYRLDGGAATSYVQPFVVTADGTHRVVATITDAAGNVSMVSRSWTEQHTATRAHIDFGAQTSTPYAGYQLDYGQPFDASRGYGWETLTGTALSLVGNGRQRNAAASPDSRYDTFLQMQEIAGSPGVLTPGRWELAVVNGTYTVTVEVGDPSATNSVHQITAERGTANAVVLVNQFAQTASTLFKTVTGTVTVTDGRLTLDPTGGTNTKLGYVDVVPA